MDWELRERDAKYNILDFYVGSSILLEFSNLTFGSEYSIAV